MNIERHYPDEILGHKASQDQKAKRHQEIQFWFDRYFTGVNKIQSGLNNAGYKSAGSIAFAEDAALHVNDVYWYILEQRVRPRIISCKGDIEVTVDRHKISSLTEIVIALTEPIEHDDLPTKRRLNASLGFFCSMNIMANWNQKIADEMFVSRSFSEAHTTWLEYLPTSTEERMPIFSNAANWYLIETLFEERHNKKLSPPAA